MDIGTAILIGLIVGSILHALLSQGMIYAGLQKVADAINKQK